MLLNVQRLLYGLTILFCISGTTVLLKTSNSSLAFSMRQASCGSTWYIERSDLSVSSRAFSSKFPSISVVDTWGNLPQANWTASCLCFTFGNPQYNWQLVWSVVRYFPLSVLPQSFSVLGREHCACLPGGKLLVQAFGCLFELFSAKHRRNIHTCALELVKLSSLQ